jgi:2-octaprenyl-6-methoxyphenol hydroxylase
MTKKQTESTDIAIIGGGVAGLTLALLLGKAGLRVVLTEPHPPAPLKDTKLSGRTVALMNSSVNIIKATDVWPDLADMISPLQTMRIIDDSSKIREPIEIEFPAQDIGQPQFGFNIPNAHLRAALFERAKKQKNVKIIKAGFAAHKIVAGGVNVLLDDAEIIKARLLIGADGRNSPVREAAGIKAKTNQYNQSAITCVINHSRAHNNVSTEFHRPSGPFALVPLQGNRSSVVWVEKTQDADAFIKLKKQDFLQALQERTKDVLGRRDTGDQSRMLAAGIHQSENADCRAHSPARGSRACDVADYGARAEPVSARCSGTGRERD